MEGSSRYSQNKERPFRLNPYATPFVPTSRAVFAESFKESEASEKPVCGTEKNEKTADNSAEYQLPDSLSLDDYAESLGKLKISNELSLEDTAGSTFDPSQYEENDMDNHLAVMEYLQSIFPDVSTDCIAEALKANRFDTELTMDMLYDLLEDYDLGYSAEVSEQQQQNQQP